MRAQFASGVKELQASVHQVCSEGDLKGPLVQLTLLVSCSAAHAGCAAVRPFNTPTHPRRTLSTHLQAIILLLFNEHEQLSFADIQAAVRLEEAELRRTLASLSVAKERCAGWDTVS